MVHLEPVKLAQERGPFPPTSFFDHNADVSAVPSGATRARFPLSPAKLSPRRLDEIGCIVQQQHATGDERDAADDNAGGFGAEGRGLLEAVARVDSTNLRYAYHGQTSRVTLDELLTNMPCSQ